jgi:hypothetical protein
MEHEESVSDSPHQVEVQEVERTWPVNELFRSREAMGAL